MKDEIGKKQRAKLINIITPKSEYAPISIKSHLIGFPSFTENNELEYNFEPYITAVQGIPDKRFGDIKTAKQMIGKLIYDNNEIGCTYEKMKKYIKLLNECADRKESGSMSGLMICIDKEKEMYSYSFDDLESLSKAMNVDLELSLSKEFDYKKEIDESNEKKVTKRLGTGKGMGM